jgi:hypothetical protein
MSSVKTADDLAGFEFDWLASDAEGYVAFFSTAGGGYAPYAFLSDTDAHQEAIDVLIASPATTFAKMAPELRSDLTNTWKLAAERGLFAFDSDPNGGAYNKIGVPAQPIRLPELPAVVRVVAGRNVLCRVHFMTDDVITEVLIRR